MIDHIENDPALNKIAEMEQTALPILDKILDYLQSREPDGLNEEWDWFKQLRILIQQSSCHAAERITAINELTGLCQKFSEIEYGFLFDESRNLLSIGYNATEHRRDPGFYDLLASEARLCSFIGIAQGCLPQEHWFASGALVDHIQRRFAPAFLEWLHV